MQTHQFISVKVENVGYNHNIRVTRHYSSPESLLKEINQNFKFSFDNITEITPFKDIPNDSSNPQIDCLPSPTNPSL
ncbi:hypothetical protein KM1_076630 [Entamoeba histolytica HM-3:IMSS]|uniref:Uncharacterized protein n=1 Tax=Entamoeba histolytica HM-3:IMSS TaxID=885315 RepID=M7X8U5_ENTHI|nr:hypothetical protein KM1_076630 [Entamoeba histolytica HM-3:IMSS]